MIKGIYSSEASMRPKMTRMEVLANNLANINSTGFKRDRLFVQMLKNASGEQGDGRTDVDGTTTERYVDFTEGSLQQTENPLDLAIQGRGLFVIETPQGIRYTRNGHFTLNEDGSVTTPEGYALLANDGAVRIPQLDRLERENIVVSDEGEIMVGKDYATHLRIVDVEDIGNLQKDHQALFFADEDQQVREVPPEERMIKQGYLEESNVDGIQEMIAMIELSRNFETDQRMIQAQDSTIDRSLDLGRV